MMGNSMREITFRQAIGEALSEEMERQPGMIIIGEDLLPGGAKQRQYTNASSPWYSSRITLEGGTFRTYFDPKVFFK